MTRVPFGIRGTGSSVPDKVLTNEDLVHMVETSDEWITQRTGIKERRIVTDGQSTSDLCIEAGRKAIADAGLDPKDIDLVVVSTVTPDQHVPATACLVQRGLGLRQVPAFDLAAGCTGFIYAANVAAQFLWNGSCRNVLVVGAECLSRITDYTDRSSCILFGDAAGAVVFSHEFRFGEVRSVFMEADGSGYDVMYQRAGGARQPLTHELLDAKAQYLVIRGREVYKFAVNRMVEMVQREQTTNPDLELGAVIPHQVNRRIIDAARERLDMPEERIYVNIHRYGNTSSASIPLALDEARSQGWFEGLDGRLVVLCAFGAGLTWGSVGICW